MKPIQRALALAAMAALVAATEGRAAGLTGSDGVASGMTINLPLVGRVVGAGNTLFRTSVDVTNNTTQQTKVDFYFDGRDNAGTTITLSGGISNSGLVPAGSALLRGSTSVHFDDFISALAAAGLITNASRDAGVTGSLMIVFDGFTRLGDGAASARFWNEFGGGTIGVSIAGREMTTDEPRGLAGLVHDTRGGDGAQLSANMFINNTGLTRSGSPGGSVTVELRAVSANTGLAVGRTTTIDIGPGQTATVSGVAGVLEVPAREPAIVFARVISGTATIHGLISTIDATTRDGSVVYMSRTE
jgi:hypothetical protein